MKIVAIYVSFIVFLMFINIGCSSRFKNPTIESDSTIVYPVKKSYDISALITLYKRRSNKTGNRIGEGNIFKIKDKASVNALVSLENCSNYLNKEIMIHVDWINPKGQSFYRKEVLFLPNSTLNEIKSAISIDPDKREQGIYSLRIYLFRELIAEKKFELLPFSEPPKPKDIGANIKLYRKISKKTGAYIGEGTKFTIKNKRSVHAQIDLGNRFIFEEEELNFKINWINTKGKRFYRKKVELSPDDSIMKIKSSISISPDKRVPGNYALQVYLFGDLITEQKFELVSKQ